MDTTLKSIPSVDAYIRANPAVMPPPPQVPTSAGEIRTTGSLVLPTSKPEVQGTANAVASVGGLKELYAGLEKQANDAQNQKLAIQNDPEQKNWLQKLLSSSSPAENRLQAQEETGIIPREYFAEQKSKIAEIEKLSEAYNAEVEARDLDIAKTEQTTLGVGATRQAVSAIERNASIRLNRMAANINAKTAVMQALQGNFKEAQDFVNQAVQDATAETKFRYDQFNTIYNLNQDKLDRLDSTYKDAFNKAFELSKMKWEQDVKDKNEVGDLMLEYPSSGIKITDSVDSARQKAANSSPGSSVLTPISQAVVDNPSLLSTLTPTVRGQVITELSQGGYDVSSLGTKPLSDVAIKEINQTNFALSSLNDLKTTIQNNLEYVGPVRGLSALNPWSKARQVQSDVDRVRQTVGKALEGGVLRKEDEEKYKKILATLTDTSETATYKIDNLIQSIQANLTDYQTLQENNGKSLNLKSSLEKKGNATQGKTATGNSYTVTKQ
jgi:hypothetical protein